MIPSLHLLIQLLFFFQIVKSQQCLQPTVRREWRQLSQSEKQSYLQAVQFLKARPVSKDLTRPETWNYDQFVDAHWSFAPTAHSVPAFFPWHRYMVEAFERAIKSVNPSLSVPYWDW
jgi:hypothetical protein